MSVTTAPNGRSPPSPVLVLMVCLIWAQHPHYLWEERLVRVVPAASLNARLPLLLPEVQQLIKDCHMTLVQFQSDDMISFVNFVQFFEDRTCWSHLAKVRSLDLHILDFQTYFYLIFTFNSTQFLLRTAWISLTTFWYVLFHYNSY